MTCIAMNSVGVNKSFTANAGEHRNCHRHIRGDRLQQYLISCQFSKHQKTKYKENKQTTRWSHLNAADVGLYIQQLSKVSPEISSCGPGDGCEHVLRECDWTPLTVAAP